jgi:uncharacterized membrane protein YhaH (DUF805 family)
VKFSEWYVCRGRITRRAWWLHYALVLVLFSFLAAIADASMGYPAFAMPDQPSGVYDYIGGPVTGFVSLFTLVPSISSSVARLHDRGHSAWWLLWMLVPVVGWILLFVQNGFLAGDGGPNRYGPAPGQVDPLGYAPQS